MSARFRVLVPVQKPTEALPRSGLRREERARLAMAFAGDTLETVRMCHAVGELVVVSPDPDVVALAKEFDAAFVESHLGLDKALNHTAKIHSSSNVQMVAAVVSDLPALQRRELDQILSEVGRRRRSAYALDLRGVGVTFHADPVGVFDACLEGAPIDRLAARDAHQVGQFTGGLRCDVDTCAAMRIAKYLGVGPRAARELELLSERVMRVNRMAAWA